MSEKLYFTRRGFEKLEKEITSLSRNISSLRLQTGRIIEVDRDKDGDNGSLESLNGEIRIIDRRLKEACSQIEKAIILENLDKRSRIAIVAIGTRVEIIKNGETIAWDVVGFGESDPDNNLIAYNTPLANLLMGKCEGECAKGTIGGEPVNIKIVKISKSINLPPILESQESLAEVV